ncbi:hypothetical protein GGR52DRAFT_187076 [Hypoxylon sp. FL1284]|nr:hypothetical protein GGR52DRAFT_187076 [Hypoxylon sp. FL1284]
MALTLADMAKHKDMRGDIYIDADSVDYKTLKAPWFWKSGGDKEFLRYTDNVIGVARYDKYSEAYRMGLDAVKYYWKQMKNINIQLGKERHERRLGFPEFRQQIKPVIFIAAEDPESGTDVASDSHKEQQLRSILFSFLKKIYDITLPDWRPWIGTFPLLPTDDMLPVIEAIPEFEIPGAAGLVEVKDRLFIIVGLDEAYCEATRDNVERFLKVLDRISVVMKAGKILLLCKKQFDPRGILGLNIDKESSVRILDVIDDPDSDSDKDKFEMDTSEMDTSSPSDEEMS